MPMATPMSAAPVLIKDAFPVRTTLDELVSFVSDNNGNKNDDDDDDNDNCNYNGNGNDNGENLRLNVDVTPDGHGDTIRIVDGKKTFVMPEVRNMSFIEFRDQLRKQGNNRTKVGQREHDGYDDNDITNGSNSLETDENGRIVFTSSKTKTSTTTSTNTSSTHEKDDNKPINSNNEKDHGVYYYSRQVGKFIFLNAKK